MDSDGRLARTLLVVLSFAAVLPALPAQEAPRPDLSIHLDVVVTARSGPPVAGLRQQDFTVLDNKTPVQVTSFRAVSGNQAQTNVDPIHVVLVVDAVNINYQDLATERDQLDRFLHANGGRLAAPTTLAFFTDKGTQIEEGFSTDGNEISTSLDKYTLGLRNIRRSSQYGASDRFQLSMTALSELAEREGSLPGRKMILWVSPGWPLLSGPGIELSYKQEQQLFSTIVGLSTRLRQGRTTLYSIDPLGTGENVSRTFYYKNFTKGVTKLNQVQVGDLGLQVIATQTGGLALSSSNDVAAQLQTCMADAQAYYEISFAPPVADSPKGDEYHNLEVRVGTPGYTARTRTGYYVQP
jgi:VWFA-related protein